MSEGDYKVIVYIYKSIMSDIYQTYTYEMRCIWLTLEDI